jgi:hypothetical protein
MLASLHKHRLHPRFIEIDVRTLCLGWGCFNLPAFITEILRRTSIRVLLYRIFREIPFFFWRRTGGNRGVDLPNKGSSSL